MHIESVLQGDNRWWKYLVSFLSIFMAILVAEVPLTAYSQYQKRKLGIDEEAYKEIMSTMNYADLGMSENMIFFLLVSSFSIMFFVLIWILPLMHKRPLLSFFTGRKRFDKGRFLVGLSVWLFIACFLSIFFLDASDYVLNFELEKFLPLLLIAILFVPIQTGVEELFFRGYLLQSLYNLFKNKWIAVAIVTILFTLAHIANPEFDKNFVNVIFGYFALSTLFGYITIIDDGLELPMGIHAGNNLFVALILSSTDGAFITPSIFKTTSESLIEIMPIALCVLSVLTFVILRFIYKWDIKTKIQLLLR